MSEDPDKKQIQDLQKGLVITIQNITLALKEAKNTNSQTLKTMAIELVAFMEALEATVEKYLKENQEDKKIIQ